MPMGKSRPRFPSCGQEREFPDPIPCHRHILTLPRLRLTDYNVAIAIISLFFLITRLIAIIMDFWFPIIILPLNIAFVALYAASLGGQAGPDYLDPTRPSRVAWYVAKPCSVAANRQIQGYCTSAKGTFAAFALML